MQDASPVRANEVELVKHVVLIQGNATVANASIVSTTGRGMSLGYSGTGLYTLTFGESPGAFVGFSFAFQASTPANVAGHSAVADDYDSTARALPVQVFNAADAAHALVANEYVALELWFRRSKV